MSFAREKRIAAKRKRAQCEGCGKWIEVGEPAYYFAQLYDGDFCSGNFHPECRDAEIEWNHLSDTWGEDWNPINSIKESDEAEIDCAWLREAFPIVAERMGI